MNNRWLLNLVLVLGLFRYLWLAMFMHPYADDLSYAYTAYQQPLFERLVNEYHHWNGRLASNILVLRGPLLLGYPDGLYVYRLVPALWILGMVGGWSLLLRAAGPRYVPRDVVFTLALGLTTLWLNTLPDLTEGLYWYTGAVTYTLPHLLLLLLVTAAIRACRSSTGMGRTGWLAVVTVFGIWIMWSNEVHLVLLVLSLPVSLWAMNAQRLRLRWLTASVAVVLLGAAIVSVLAPGNAVRASHFQGGGDVLHTAGWSALQTVRFVGTWLLSPALLLTSMLALVWARGRRDLPRITVHWSRWAALMLAVVVICVALPYWATGMLGQHRTVNVAWSMFLPLWGVFLLALDQQLVQPKGIVVPSTRAVRTWLTVAVVLAFFAGGNDGRVAHDLLTGVAARNDQALNERYKAIRAAAEASMPELHVTPLPERTAALRIMELDADPAHWTNGALVHYLGAHPLRVRTGASAQTQHK